MREALRGNCEPHPLPITTMTSFPFPDPPTQSTLSQARREVITQRNRVSSLSSKIQDAEDELAQLVKERRCAIQELERERTAAEEHLAQTLAYCSPIRRLPNEILGQIFMCIFEELPCCAWVLSAVSSLWRRRVLAMPKLWSKVCHAVGEFSLTFRCGRSARSPDNNDVLCGQSRDAWLVLAQLASA